MVQEQIDMLKSRIWRKFMLKSVAALLRLMVSRSCLEAINLECRSRSDQFQDAIFRFFQQFVVVFSCAVQNPDLGL